MGTKDTKWRHTQTRYPKPLLVPKNFLSFLMAKITKILPLTLLISQKWNYYEYSVSHLTYIWGRGKLLVWYFIVHLNYNFAFTCLCSVMYLLLGNQQIMTLMWNASFLFEFSATAIPFPYFCTARMYCLSRFVLVFCVDFLICQWRDLLISCNKVYIPPFIDFIDFLVVFYFRKQH